MTEEPPAWKGYRPEFDEQPGAGLRDAFARLYTPHRLAYIKGENKPAEGDLDPFCRIPERSDADGADRRAWHVTSTRCSTSTRTTPVT